MGPDHSLTAVLGKLVKLFKIMLENQKWWCENGDGDNNHKKMNQFNPFKFCTIVICFQFIKLFFTMTH